jgi:predicted DNA-binding helix-hairpin-helix protein
MDRHRRLQILAEAALGDREHGLATRPVGTRPVRLPGGGVTTIMRVMQTNACALACGYCPLHRGARVRRVSLAPEEVATTFSEALRRGLAHGLFLTSGVGGRAVRAVDQMLAAVEILRRRERFTGYVHVKLLPGTEPGQIEAAVRLANRVSINLEAPTDQQVRFLAAEKNLGGDLLPALERVGRLMLRARAERGMGAAAPAGATTQFVVGRAGERDREILALVARLESRRLLHHAHFSAFQPVAGTPFEAAAPTSYTREQRLYQAEYLLRRYGFRQDELVFGADGNLPLDRDPKTAWALTHPELFPVEITAAARELLLRVPGIGPKTADALVAQRRHVAIRDARDLHRLGIDMGRAGYFLALRGRRVVTALPPEQLRLLGPDGGFAHAPWRTAVPPCAFR